MRPPSKNSFKPKVSAPNCSKGNDVDELMNQFHGKKKPSGLAEGFRNFRAKKLLSYFFLRFFVVFFLAVFLAAFFLAMFPPQEFI